MISSSVAGQASTSVVASSSKTTTLSPRQTTRKRGRAERGDSEDEDEAPLRSRPRVASPAPNPYGLPADVYGFLDSDDDEEESDVEAVGAQNESEDTDADTLVGFDDEIPDILMDEHLECDRLEAYVKEPVKAPRVVKCKWVNTPENDEKEERRRAGYEIEENGGWDYLVEDSENEDEESDGEEDEGGADVGDVDFEYEMDKENLPPLHVQARKCTGAELRAQYVWGVGRGAADKHHPFVFCERGLCQCHEAGFGESDGEFEEEYSEEE